jgi:hypothetical protein
MTWSPDTTANGPFPERQFTGAILQANSGNKKQKQNVELL